MPKDVNISTINDDSLNINENTYTGVAGFIGSHISKYFISEGYKVVGIDDLSSGKMKNIPSEVDFLNLDLTDINLLSKIPYDCEIILHLAGQSSGEISYKDPIEDLKKNTVSTLNLINYGIKNNCKKILFASSMSVYGDAFCNNCGVKEGQSFEPKSCYGIGKLASEKYLNIFKNKLPFVALRMFNVYGPGQDMENMKQGMVSIYLSQALKYKEIIVKGSLKRFRDFVYIDDVVEAWYRASFCEDALNQAINLGTGTKTTVYELIEEIKVITGVDNIKVEGETPCDQLGIFSNNKKLSEILKFQPKVSLSHGLRSFYEFSKK